MSQTEFQALFKAAPKIFEDLAILVDKNKLNSHDHPLRGAISRPSEKYLIILEDSSVECLLHELQHYDLYRLVGVEGANFMLDNAPKTDRSRRYGEYLENAPIKETKVS